MSMNLDTGIIEVTDKGHVVRRRNAAYLLQEQGVFCENPGAPEADRIYAKLFENPGKKIYLPDQYDLAYREVLTGRNVIRFGANGYSDLKPDRCAYFGIEPGAYEEACFGLLKHMYDSLCADYAGVDIRIVHGASNCGIDKVLIRLANQYNRNQLGHSCPGFMFYVDPNDGVPVYVGANKETYADAFIRSLDMLIACNGGEQAFLHDIAATFRHKKHLIPVNVLRAISRSGGPSAISAGGKIDDAVSAFEHRVHMANTEVRNASNPFIALAEHLSESASTIARTDLLCPALAFANVSAHVARYGKAGQ